MNTKPSETAGSGILTLRHAQDARSFASAYVELHRIGELSRPPWFWRWLVDRLDIEPGMRMLDVACGNGALSDVLRANGHTPIGVDLLARGSRSASAPDVPALARADGERLPFGDGLFDRVACVGSLEHFVDPTEGASEIARVLAPGGKALVLLPNAFGLRGPVLHAWRTGDAIDDGQPIQRYAPRVRWERLLEGSGLITHGVYGVDSLTPDPRSPSAWLGAIKHPTRLLALAQRHLPVNMALELVFICRRTPERHGVRVDARTSVSTEQKE